MANYALLRRGDKLPAVGVLQKLLNRGGAGLTVDGDFGSATQTAVSHFQRNRGLAPDGAVGQNTWPRISAYANLPIVDCVDVFDPDLANWEARDIRRAGGTPLLIEGMSNGVQDAVEAILAAAPRNVFLLRFHGHGAPGNAGISDGEGVGPGHRSDISPRNLSVVLPIIGRLRPIFGPYGCVQFMHCQTGRGASGRTVLSKIANQLGVPVSAGVQDQFGGGLDTFRFEGPTVTLLPGSLTLPAWAAGRPDFAAMSVE